MKLLRYICFLLPALALVCCTATDASEEDASASTQRHTCELILNVDKPTFDTTTRTDVQWSPGDKIYLTFYVGDDTTFGDAVYDGSRWQVNYYGNLATDVTAKCAAVYFDSPDFTSNSVVQLTANTAIYEDRTASYVFSGGTISVTAALAPKTGRMRFAGTNGNDVTVSGISHYTSYDVATGTFIAKADAVNEKVQAGYTPYIYGFFTDADLPRINLITSESGFNRVAPADIFLPGQSGFMTIPSVASHTGWQNSLILTACGVQFTMIPVKCPEGNFFLAETETTEELYAAVMGGKATDSRLPAYYHDYSDWIKFITYLKGYTGLEFRIPTVDEWQYAYAGGERSRGYTYSGSNNINDVAWYTGNANSVRHEVRMLQPNELGFYDMAGNVAELAYNGSYRWLGGYWSAIEVDCKASLGLSASYYYYSGFRIAL